MRAELARAARCREGSGQELQAQRGRLVRRALERVQQAGRSRNRAAQRPTHREQAVRQPRPHADHGAAGPPHPQDARPRARCQAPGVRKPGTEYSTGRPAKRWLSARCCSKAMPCACLARTAGAARSASATPSGSIRPTSTSTCRSPTVPHGRFEVHRQPAFGIWRARLRIRLCDRRSQDAGAVGSAVRRFRQRRADHHRPVHRRSAKPSGCAPTASCCCCRMATKARGRSIPRRGWSASSSSARRTISRSATSPPRRTISTCCAARCTGRSASR